MTQLRQRYGEVFGEETNGRNKAWLVKRIAWRMQVQAEGGLSERGPARAEELADEADLRLRPQAPEKESAVRVLPCAADERRPPSGTVIAREYKGRTPQVKVRADGFEYEGEVPVRSVPRRSGRLRHAVGRRGNEYSAEVEVGADPPEARRRRSAELLLPLAAEVPNELRTGGHHGAGTKNGTLSR